MSNATATVSARDTDGTIGARGPELATAGLGAPRPRWIELATSSDHKDVGRIQIGASLAFLFLGIVAFLLMRLQLAVPDNTLIEPVTFNRLLTIGSVSLVVLFAVPLAFGLYTYLLPLQIGARSTAFPRLGQLGLWLYVFGGGLLYVSFVYTPPEIGFNALPPLSDTTFIDNNGTDIWVTTVGLATLGMVFTAINLVVTVSKLRAPGLAWRRLPSFSVSGAVSGWLMIVAGSGMLAALVMLEIDRHFGGIFFDAGEGGAPLYFQHLSWIFFTGCFLIIVILAVGAISEILPVFSGKPMFSRNAVSFSIAAVAAIGLLAWMQNMYTAPIPKGFLYFAMAAALLLIVPFGVIFANWLATLYGGALRLRAPMVFALASLSTLSFGLLGQLSLAIVPVGWLLGGTADATAETGYMLIGGAVLGGLSALHYWFPKITGRTVAEGPALASAVLIVAGAHLTFVPLFLAGLAGMPADVFKFYEGTGLSAFNLVATLGSFVLAGGVVLALVNLMRSVNNGPVSGPDPWGGESLEWFALSPPPPHNFDVVPDVRSDEPLRDIREAISRRSAASGAVDANGQPVA